MMKNDPDPSPAAKLTGVDIEISVLSSDWSEALPGFEEICRQAADAALAAGDLEADAAELSLVLGDDHLLRQLNRDWRGIDKPTNVLSFPSGDTPPPGAPLLLGDVILAFETMKGEAAAQDKTLGDHLSHLVIHGVLHLLGFDHEEAAEAEAMEALETRILSGLGIADPYREAAHG